MPVKNKIVGSQELDALIKEGRFEDAVALSARQVKWLYSNSSKTAMVVDEKLVHKIIASFQEKIRDLENPSKPISDHGSTYDEFFGDERICKCGHLYRQHFDSAENMRHIGCKYCSCYDFKENVPAMAVKL